MRFLLVLGLIFIGACLSFIKPIFAAAFMLWVDIFRPFGWAKVAEPFPIAKIVVGIFAASFMISWFRGALKPRPNRATFGIFLFLLWSLVSTLISSSPEIAMVGFSKEIKILLPIMFTSMIYMKIQDIEFMVWTLAISVGIYASQAGLHALIVGHPVTDMAIDGGQMSDRNDFVVATLIAIPLILYMVRFYSGFFKLPVRIFSAIALILSIVAVPLSNSRGGILGFAGTILFTTALSKKKWRNLLLLAIFVPIGLYLVPESTWDRLNTIELSTHQQEGSAGERMQQMAGGLRMMQDHWLSGVGPYAFIEHVLLYTPAKLEPHCIWIKCGAELGLPGLIIYMGTIGWVFWGLFSIYRRYIHIDKKISGLAIYLCMAHVGFCLASTFGNQLYSEYYWCLIALSGGFISLLNQKRFGEFR